MQEKVRAMPKESQPAIIVGPDLKWRYMWNVGPRPLKTQFKELNSAPVIPEGFPGWTETMNSWGSKMIAAVEVVAEMAAIGFGLPKDAFTSLISRAVQYYNYMSSFVQKHIFWNDFLASVSQEVKIKPQAFQMYFMFSFPS
uniref:Uncharacterized protein n=1 Tax=Fagus sylvatica TaxID=28930 RepID=A0A2N9EL59_FAGSY